LVRPACRNELCDRTLGGTESDLALVLARRGERRHPCNSFGRRSDQLGPRIEAELAQPRSGVMRHTSVSRESERVANLPQRPTHRSIKEHLALAPGKRRGALSLRIIAPSNDETATICIRQLNQRP